MTEHKIDAKIEHKIKTPSTNVLAIISLVLSLIGLFLIPIAAHIASIICGHIARSQISQSGGSQTGSGIALAGLIISYLSIVFYLIAILFLGVGFLALISAI